MSTGSAAHDGRERLRRWREEERGVPPAFGRFGAQLVDTGLGRTVVRLPLTDELRLPDSTASGAVTCLLADFGVTTAVIASLPDLRGVATITMSVDHLGPPPASGALVAHCSAAPHVDDGPRHAAGRLEDDDGRVVALVSAWLLPAPAEAVHVERVGVPVEPPAPDLLHLLAVPGGPVFDLHVRDALSNALGTLHGGVGALASQLAAEAALGGALCPLTSRFTYLRPTPRDGDVTVRGTAVRRGRRTGAAGATVTGQDGSVVLTAELVGG